MSWLQIDDGGRIGEGKRGGAGGELEEEEEEEEEVEVVVVVVVSNICSPIEVKGCLLVISSDMKKTDQPTNQPTYQPINSFLYRCVDPSKMYPTLLQ